MAPELRERAGAPAGMPGPVEVRISGLWRWRTVVVPPNAFVVHTRRGRSAPPHIGLGVSFRYNPASDSFLVVPGATQTILINAYGICRNSRACSSRAIFRTVRIAQELNFR